jgi:hypothetical protein
LGESTTLVHLFGCVYHTGSVVRECIRRGIASRQEEFQSTERIESRCRAEVRVLVTDGVVAAGRRQHGSSPGAEQRRSCNGIGRSKFESW